MNIINNMIDSRVSNIKQILYIEVDRKYRSEYRYLMQCFDDIFPVREGNVCFSDASSNATFIKQRDIINSIKF